MGDAKLGLGVYVHVVNRDTPNDQIINGPGWARINFGLNHNCVIAASDGETNLIWDIIGEKWRNRIEIWTGAICGG